MDIAHTPAAERIARVLCGQRLSANAGAIRSRPPSWSTITGASI